MKKKSIFFALPIAFCLLLAVCFTACGGDAIKSITLETDIVTLLFELNSDFTAENLAVIGKRGDGKQTRIKLSDCNISAPDMTTEGEKTVTVSYNGMEASYKINVIVFKEIAKFTGTLTGAIYGMPATQNVTLSCINNGKYEMRYDGEDTIYDSGVYVETDGVYTFTVTANDNEKAITSVENGVISFEYVGLSLPVFGGALKTKLSGTLTLQE